MKKLKIFLIDCLIFAFGFFIVDHFFENINEIFKLIIYVLIVLVSTFIMKELFHYDDKENDK